MREIEDYRVELSGVSVLELTIVPNISGGAVRASLKSLAFILTRIHFFLQRFFLNKLLTPNAERLPRIDVCVIDKTKSEGALVVCLRWQRKLWPPALQSTPQR